MTAAELAARRRQIRALVAAERSRKALAAVEQRHQRDARVPGRDHPLRNGGVHRARPRQAGAVDRLILELLTLALLCAVVIPLFDAGGWLALGIVASNVLVVGGLVVAALALGAGLGGPKDGDR